MAIWLAALAIDRWRLAEGAGPFSPSSSEEGGGGWWHSAPPPAGQHHHQPPPLKSRGHEAEPPLVLVAESAHGPRIIAATPAGHDAGARAGMLLADARALCPDLVVAPADPAGDLALLERLALWARRWGPWSALDPPDGLIVDVTGVAHLFGGEDALLADARARFTARGLAVRLAIAPTAGAAWGLAHHGPPDAILPPLSSSLRGGEADEAIRCDSA